MTPTLRIVMKSFVRLNAVAAVHRQVFDARDELRIGQRAGWRDRVIGRFHGGPARADRRGFRVGQANRLE
jgi:hypothetical protein